MSKHPSSQPRNDEPLFWVGQFPVRLVTLLIAIHTLTMVATALLVTFGRASWVDALLYNSTAVWHGQVLRLVTYAFVNPPSIWFALEMLMLYYFGREVERGLGSKVFGLFYLGLICLSPVVLQALSLITGMSQQLSGAQAMNFAIFAAFVAMHPTLPFLFGISARWMLGILLTLSSLQLLEAHEFTSALLFLGESLAAILFMKAQGYDALLPTFSMPSWSRRVKQASAATTAPTKKTPTSSRLLGSCSTTTSFISRFSKQDTLPENSQPALAPIINIDGLLEKISQTGMSSLSEQEKEQLTKASTALLERDEATSRR